MVSKRINKDTQEEIVKTGRERWKIAHIIRQLMENGIEIYKNHKKRLKDISVKLFELFRTRILTKEEIKEATKKCQIRFYKEDTS